MLVDGKFIFINIPRCATTSFKLTCEKNNISTKNASFNLEEMGTDFYNLSVTEKAQGHEPLNILYEKFGENLPVVAIRRNKYERIYSFWKQTVSMYDKICEILPKENNIKTREKLRSLNSADLFFFDEKKYSLINGKDVSDLIKVFADRCGIEYDFNLDNYMRGFYLHPKYLHLDDPRIIWFDFKKLNEFENWVSSILGLEFRMVNINSSEKVECELKLDDEFINQYERVYSRYEKPKKEITLF